jgi:hypothetical protein
MQEGFFMASVPENRLYEQLIDQLKSQLVIRKVKVGKDSNGQEVLISTCLVGSLQEPSHHLHSSGYV